MILYVPNKSENGDHVQQQHHQQQQQPNVVVAQNSSSTASSKPEQHRDSASSTVVTSSSINNDERTVFASPIHFKATDAEITSFFSQFGTVSSVERRRYLVRGVAKLRPSVFVMFATKDEAQKCVAAKPSYGRVPSALGQMFVPHLIVSMKGDPVTRDAISDETEKAEKVDSLASNSHNHNDHGDGSANGGAGAGGGGGPSHRRLIQRGLICVARGVPHDIPARDVQSKLGSIIGVGKGVIDIAYFPADSVLSNHGGSNSNSSPSNTATKICYVYCTSAMGAATLLQCYNRVFKENEKYAESLGQSVPLLEKCQDSEEELAMDMYSEAVAGRTQKKMEKNNHHHQQSGGGGGKLLQHHDTVRRGRE